MTRITAFLFAAIIAATSFAQNRKVFDLGADYGLTGLQSKVVLSSSPGTIAAAQAKYPTAYARCKGLGWTDAKFLSLTAFDAAWMDAVYKGQSSGDPTQYLNSQNHVTVPPGQYWQTIGADFSGGEYVGQGTAFVGETVSNVSVNTELVIWHERWNGDPAERNNLQAGTLGRAGNASYVEGTVIRGFRLNGRSSAVPSLTYRGCGIRMNAPGEVTYTTDIFATDHRTYGLDISGATPHHLGTISVFDNVVAGIGCDNCWGATVRIDMLSGDDNGAMIASLNSTAYTGGGSWSIGSIKLETCVASSGRAWRGQAVGVFQGQFAVDIGTISASCSGCDVDAQFVTDARQHNGNPQTSMLRVGAMKGYNFATAVHDVANRKGWRTPGDYQAYGFEWSSRNAGTLTSAAPMAQFAACAQRVDFLRSQGTPSHTTCTAYRNIIDGPPRNASTIYLGDVVAPPPPTPGTWTCTSWTAWSACASNTQTRTRVCTCGPTGSTCADPKPAEAESQACTVTPPPPPPPSGAGINPADVTILANSSDTRSAAWATAYATAWGIPASNIVSVAAGTSHDATTTAANALRTAAQSAGRQFTALAFEYPSRVGSQSITSFVTFGSRSVSSMTVSPLYGYTGTKPFTDKGVRPSWLLVSNGYIRRDAHGTNPTGQAILLCAKDMNSSGNLRGAARAGQATPGVALWDNRSISNIGSGVNPCNWISRECWVSTRNPGTTPVIAGYQSMYGLGSDGGTVWAKGFYGDHVTSWGGYLPSGNGGQTPLTYHLDRGASLSVGAVVEPWQDKSGYSPGSLVEQFVNVTQFHPRFVAGAPVGIAAWSAVLCPDRALFAGDGMCAPFLK